MIKFRPNLGKFCPKRVTFEFESKKRTFTCFKLQRLGLKQNISKSLRTDCKKNAKSLHFMHLGQNSQKVENYQKSAWNIFLAPRRPN